MDTFYAISKSMKFLYFSNSMYLKIMGVAVCKDSFCLRVIGIYILPCNIKIWQNFLWNHVILYLPLPGDAPVFSMLCHEEKEHKHRDIQCHYFYTCKIV